jgi:hypothetical protein
MVLFTLSETISCLTIRYAKEEYCRLYFLIAM